MQRLAWFSIPIAWVVLGSAGTAEGRPGDIPSFAREVPRIEAGDLVFAFNGRDLAGFYAYTRDHGYDDPIAVFTVRDGMIRISGEEFGGLATGGNFADYRLLVEWKWGTKTWPPREKAARDSGILLHCVGPDGAAGGQWMESIECQLIEGGCGDLLMVGGKGRPSLTCETRVGLDRQLYFEKGGKLATRDAGRFNWWGRDSGWNDVIGFRDSIGVERPGGEWNVMEVVCDGDRITNILNGLVVNIGTGSSLKAGKIQLQSEGAEIFVRKFEIRPLRKPAR